jgi:glycosyltransferase involved in cell wall biosynthesis
VTHALPADPRPQSPDDASETERNVLFHPLVTLACQPVPSPPERRIGLGRNRMDVHRLTYAVVTPVRDEARSLPPLAESLLSQSVHPSCWVIADTGSTDETPEVIEHLASQVDWIVPTRIEETTKARGGPIVRAFSHGLSRVVPPTDVVVKLDADMTMGSNFFESLLERFETTHDLGIAGGSLHEWEHGEWRPRYGTDDFVRGGCRAYRWQCLQDVLPLEERIGWDGLDLVKARIGGWKTGQFQDLPVFHHRSVGAREHSQAKSWYEMGDAMHYMGYRPSYAFLAGIFNARTDLTSVASIAGFWMAGIRRKPKHSDPRVLSYVRDQQRLRNLPRRAAEKLGKR